MKAIKKGEYYINRFDKKLYEVYSIKDYLIKLICIDNGVWDLVHKDNFVLKYDLMQSEKVEDLLFSNYVDNELNNILKD